MRQALPHSNEALSSGLFPQAVAVKGQIEGPITLSAYLFHRGRPFLSDPALFAAVAFHISQIVCWQIDRLKAAGLPVLLFVDEPALCLEAPAAEVDLRRKETRMRWRSRSRMREFAERTRDCIAVQPGHLNECFAPSRTSYHSMPTRASTYSLPILMRWTSCITAEWSPMA